LRYFIEGGGKGQGPACPAKLDNPGKKDFFTPNEKEWIGFAGKELLRKKIKSQ